MNKKRKLDKSLIVLLFVNIFPIIGVVFLKWNYVQIIVLYFIESIFIGLINVLKMITARKNLSEKEIEEYEIDEETLQNLEENSVFVKIVLIIFFLIHYNVFIGIQGMFVVYLLLKDSDIDEMMSPEYLLTLLFIFGSHLYSYIVNYIRKGENKRVLVTNLMTLPYRRVILQQFTIVFGAFLFAFTNISQSFFIIFIVFKIFFDVRAHNKTHSQIMGI